MEATLSRFKVAALLLPLCLLLRTESMEVTSSGPQTIQKAQGQSVTLGCTYTPGPQDTGELDIEWSNVSPDMTQKDALILSFTGGQTLYYGAHGLSDRLKFSGDPQRGDASVSFTNLRRSDTATYQCKVKKAPGVDVRKVTLVVMVPPESPKCWVEGGEVRGSDVSLRCKSYKGSAPMTYTWRRESGAMPAKAVQDSASGELLIKNHTDSYTGNYVCEARNPVGSAQCKYELHAYNPTNKAGVIAGAVIGALLLLLLLLLLIWLLCCCCRKRRYEKEVANEIREDAVAPESRPSSRMSSLRSVMGYRTHPGVQYSTVNSLRGSGRSFTHGGGGGGGVHATSPTSTLQKPPHASLQYDHRYGYPV